MKTKKFMVRNIPAILWGDKTDKLFIAIHGRMSHKADDVIAILAEEATKNGYQVLSFDLPEHGDRKDSSYACDVKNCVDDLNAIMGFAESISENISIFACSMGAYFALLAYKDNPLKRCVFLSPVVNMEMIIRNMMRSFDVTEDRLKTEKKIVTPAGTLSWDYYFYVKSNPIEVWDKPTLIICGSNDDVCGLDAISKFSDQFNCNLMVLESGGHYFHTPEELQFFRDGLKKYILS
jgi:esterase/lipase